MRPAPLSGASGSNQYALHGRRSSGYEAASQPEPQHTAVICANDMTAIGALRACKELGVQVPDEISIIGINDIPNVRYASPK